MSKFFLFICVFLVGCGGGKFPPDRPLRTTSPIQGLPDNEYIQRGLDVILLDEVKTNLYFLASKELDGRKPGTDGEKKATEAIAAQFKEFGLKPGGQNGSYFQPNNGGQNVIGYFEGNDPKLKEEVLVIGGHHDHLGNGYLGADDNASGTVAVMEIAKAFSRMNPMMKRTVVFITFTAEERGLLGSDYYVNNPTFPMTKTIYMMNFDMVGYLRDKNLKLLGGSASTFMSSLATEIAPKYKAFITPSLTQSAGGGSDHVSFIGKKVPASFFHTGTHANYHTRNDTPDKINYEGLTEICKYSFEIAFYLSFLEKYPVADRGLLLNDEETKKDHGIHPFIQKAAFHE